jgi:hypothetical protein
MKNQSVLLINTTHCIFLIFKGDVILAAIESRQPIISFDSEKSQKIQAFSIGSSQMKLKHTKWNEKLFDELDLRQEDRHHISHCFI